jgi:hypothetical protein
MKLLLTSAGISNTSIRNALVDLLGKPIAESRALFPSSATVIRQIRTLREETSSAPNMEFSAFLAEEYKLFNMSL